MDSQAVGLFYCLAAASCWSVAIVWFRGPIRDHGAPMINLAKNVQGALLLTLTLVAIGQGAALMGATSREIMLSASSGLIGMAIGDTALFAAVDRIGAHRTLLFQTTVPIFAATQAFLFQGERLDPSQLLGAIVILVGVLVVVASHVDDGRHRGSILGMGGFFALLAALGQSTGIVIAKEALGTLGVLPVAVLRLSFAAAGLLLLVLLRSEKGDLRRLFLSSREFGRVAGPAVLGTYLAILLMLAGLARAPVSLSAVLLSLTPVIVLFVEARADRRRVTPQAFVGTLVAVGGVAILTMTG